MNRATRLAASTLGVYAGLIGVIHGYSETLQGNIAHGGLMINAIGPPCQSVAVWHACLPAMTIVPSFLATGIIAIIISLIALVWAAVFIQWKHGGSILILLTILMLLVGGGFIPTFVGLFAGVAATSINTPLTFWRTHLSGRTLSFLAKFWPWTLIVFLVWSLIQWILGYFFNQTMINLSCFLLFFSYLGLPLLTVLTGFACDIHNLDRAVVG